MNLTQSIPDAIKDRPVTFSELWMLLKSFQSDGDEDHRSHETWLLEHNLAMREFKEHIQAIESTLMKQTAPWKSGDELVKAAAARWIELNRKVQAELKATQSAGSESSQTMYLVPRAANGD